MSSSVLPMFSSKSFIVSGIYLGLQSILNLSLCMVLGSVLISFFYLHRAIQFSKHHLLKMLFLPHCVFLPPLSNIRYPSVHGFISGLSILFHWSTFLFLCQYHTVLMNVALQYHLKVRKVDSSSSILFSQYFLGYLGSFVFPYEL